MSARTMDRCRLCGLPEQEHHVFAPINAPKGCVCDMESWGDPTNIPAVCEHFTPGDRDHGVCRTCEHDKACHAKPKGRRTSR